MLVRAAHFFALHALAFPGCRGFLVAAEDVLAELVADLAVVRGAALGLHHAVTDRLHRLARGLHLVLEFGQAGPVPGHRSLSIFKSRDGFAPARFERAEFLLQFALRPGDLVVLTADEIELENFEVAGD